MSKESARSFAFLTGTILFALSTIAFAYVNRHLLLWFKMSTYSFPALPIEIGLVITVLSFALILVGKGRYKMLIAACSGIECYLWFSLLALLVQVR